MKKLIALTAVLQLLALNSFSQQVIQTPFGPKRIEEPAGQPAQPPQTPQQAPAAAPQQPPAAAPQPAPVQVTPPAAPPTVPADARPAPAAQVAGQSPDDVIPIALDFDNQDIYQVIRIICDTLNLTYIIDPSVKGNVNIHTSGTLHRSDLLPILEAILKINGATIIKNGTFYSVVPVTSATRQPLQVQERTAAGDPDDQMVTEILRMKFVAASEMSRILTPYISEGANIVVHDTGNILLVTERRSNLRKLLEIVDIFDTNAFEGERVRMVPVKNSLARDLIADLKTIFAGYALSENTTAIRFLPIERMNSILVISPNPAVFPEVEKWIERLDQPSASAGIRTFVYKVKNSKASDIQRVLADLYGSRVQLSTNYQPAPGTVAAPVAPAAGATTSPFAGSVQPPLPSDANSGTAIVQTGPVKIIADEINNALLIQTTPQTYADLVRTIEELDILKRQVLIDAQIYEVTLDDSLSFGLTATLQNRGTLTPQTTARFDAPSGGVPALVGTTFAFIGRSRELFVFLNASENRSRVRTLSAPSVLVSDNMTADFQVGAEIPVATSSSVTPVTSGGSNLFAQTISFRPTGVILRVKPQINQNGNVTMDIAQEVSQASASTPSSVVLAPTIGKSSINSNIIVQDGQTIALGGFIRDNNELGRARIPLLGRIPGLGMLLGNTHRGASRSELIVLITPHVLRSHEEADLATEELKARLSEVKKLLN